MNTIMFCVLLAGGFVLLVLGSNAFVDGSSALASRVGIPQMVIGLTIVAMGTSLPEASVSLRAAMDGYADLSYGNIIGSNIYNILVILGISALIKPLVMKKSTVVIEIPFLIVVTITLLAMTMDGKLTWIDGMVLLILFGAYLLYLYGCFKMKRQDDMHQILPWWKIVIYILAGLSMIIVGSEVSVVAATNIARVFGISERVIGLTIVAIGTSLPELFTSVIATRKGNVDIAVGNIVGSNIFNILFILAVTSIITPINMKGSFAVDTLIAFATSLLLWVFILFSRRQKLEKSAGGVMLILYIGYMIYLI